MRFEGLELREEIERNEVIDHERKWIRWGNKEKWRWVDEKKWFEGKE